MTALVVEGLEVRYGAVRAVRDLSFTVEPGEIVGLIGPNGAGQSSTLHAIMLLLGRHRPGASRRRIALGRKPEDVARSGIALVPEGRRIFGELSVEENLRLGLDRQALSVRSGGADRAHLELFRIAARDSKPCRGRPLGRPAAAAGRSPRPRRGARCPAARRAVARARARGVESSSTRSPRFARPASPCSSSEQRTAAHHCARRPQPRALERGAPRLTLGRDDAADTEKLMAAHFS